MEKGFGMKRGKEKKKGGGGGINPTTYPPFQKNKK